MIPRRNQDKKRKLNLNPNSDYMRNIIGDRSPMKAMPGQRLQQIEAKIQNIEGFSQERPPLVDEYLINREIHSPKNNLSQTKKPSNKKGALINYIDKNGVQPSQYMAISNGGLDRQQIILPNLSKNQYVAKIALEMA